VSPCVAAGRSGSITITNWDEGNRGVSSSAGTQMAPALSDLGPNDLRPLPRTDHQLNAAARVPL
jgi:hypothetical protein